MENNWGRDCYKI